MPACLDLGSITFNFLPGDKSLSNGGLPFLSLLGGFCFSVCSVEESNFRYACGGEAMNDGGYLWAPSGTTGRAGGRPSGPIFLARNQSSLDREEQLSSQFVATRE